MSFKIKAGAANCSIDFPQRMFPTDGLKGVHDAPYIGVLLLDAGVKCAFISAELVNVPDDAMDMSRQIVSEAAGIPFENIWFHATHTITSPHAPGGMGPKPGGPGAPGGPKGPGSAPMGKAPDGPKPGGRPEDPDAPMKRECFIEAIRKAITECAAKAAADFSEARIGVGTGTSDIAVNRDIESPFGWWIGLGGTEPTDKEMTVIRVERPDGTPVCFLVSYAVKPCAIDNSEKDTNSRLVSRDVPGYACKIAEEKLGAPVIYFTPAAANMVPREQAWYDTVDAEGHVVTIDIGVEEGVRIVERLGAEMGEDIVNAAAGIACTLEEAEVRKTAGAIQADARGRGAMPKTPLKSQEFVFEKKQEVGSEVFAIGDIAFVSVKPEVCAQTGIELKERSPFAHTILMSMTNGGMKYMPDKLSYERVTWEAQNTMLLPGSAEQWEDMVIGLLESLK